MRNSLIKIIILTYSVILTNTVFAQSNTWEEYYLDDNIKIEYNYMICDFSSTASQELVVFKFTNLSNKNIKLEYETKIWNNNKEINTKQNDDEFRKIIRLEGNETITTNCLSKWNGYNIFSAFIENETKERHAYLTKFVIHNLTTTDE